MIQLSQKYCYFLGWLKCWEIIVRRNILKILGCLFKDLVSLEWCKKRKKNLQNKTFILQFHSGWGSCKDIISCLGNGSTFSLTEMVLFSFSLFSVYFGPAFLGLPKCVTIRDYSTCITCCRQCPSVLSVLSWDQKVFFKQGECNMTS